MLALFPALTSLKTIHDFTMSILASAPFTMNGLSYPTSHQSSDSFTTQLYFPTSTSASLAVPTYRAATNLQIRPQQAFRELQTLALSPNSTLSTASPSPLGWSAPSRQTSRPCRCGRGTCRWRFFYPDRLMIAVHEVLPFLIQPQGFPSAYFHRA